MSGDGHGEDSSPCQECLARLSCLARTSLARACSVKLQRRNTKLCEKMNTVGGGGRGGGACFLSRQRCLGHRTPERDIEAKLRGHPLGRFVSENRVSYLLVVPVSEENLRSPSDPREISQISFLHFFLEKKII